MNALWYCRTSSSQNIRFLDEFLMKSCNIDFVTRDETTEGIEEVMSE